MLAVFNRLNGCPGCTAWQQPYSALLGIDLSRQRRDLLGVNLAHALEAFEIKLHKTRTETARRAETEEAVAVMLRTLYERMLEC